ncbi:MAG: biopolymer transporter ExbD [Myxococcales bacterium]|nr:biopolymer transporter ExbD [Myxococcales bacterium]MCB9718688.1 biopolymer transporter ExbD [Myxococcales bacterium]
MALGSSRGGFREINVTPLVDVLLVLLVVFMVTAPLLATGLRVELPTVDADVSPLKDSRLVITITAEGRIELGDQDVTEDVEGVLLRDERVRTRRELYIRADERVPYGVVARVVAAARVAGVEGLNLLVQPELEERARARGGQG